MGSSRRNQRRTANAQTAARIETRERASSQGAGRTHPTARPPAEATIRDAESGRYFSLPPDSHKGRIEHRHVNPAQTQRRVDAQTSRARKKHMTSSISAV